MHFRRSAYRTLYSCVGIALSVILASNASAQVPTIVELHAKGKSIVDAAVAAHGGVEALNQARQMRVTIVGRDLWRNQSRSPNAPYDAEPLFIELHVDLARGKIVRDQWSQYPGGVRRDSRAIADDSAANHFVNLRTQTFQPWPPGLQASVRDPNLLYLPQFVLLRALENTSLLRSIGPIRLSTGESVDAVTTVIGNSPWTLIFDPNTHLLRGWTNVINDALVGNASLENEIIGYHHVNGVLLPTRRVTRIAGEVTREIDYRAATPGYVIPDSLVKIPDGFKPEPTGANEPVRTLADGVWQIGSVLAVAFTDHVLIFDAAGSAASVIRHLGNLAPGKPIRYVIPTHHHDDHSSASRDYAAAGATIVTTPGNRAYMERMAASQRIELVNKRRVFSDGIRTVEVHDIGPNPHANEMLVAWLPNEGILFQGDLVETVSDGSVLPGSNNETTQHFAQWLRRQRWDVKVLTGTHGALREPSLLDEILRQPLRTSPHSVDN